MMWNDGYGWGWGSWVLMGGMMIVFWGLLILIGIALVHFLRTGAGGGRSDADDGNKRARAEALLGERLARGEIDEDAYRKLIAVLRETQP